MVPVTEPKRVEDEASHMDVKQTKWTGHAALIQKRSTAISWLESTPPTLLFYWPASTILTITKGRNLWTTHPLARYTELPCRQAALSQTEGWSLELCPLPPPPTLDLNLEAHVDLSFFVFLWPCFDRCGWSFPRAVTLSPSPEELWCTSWQCDT